MVIFSRSRAGRHAKAEESLTPAEKRRQQRAVMLAELDLDQPDGHVPVQAQNSKKRFVPSGPFDLEKAPPANRLDLGSLLVPSPDGVEIRLQAADDGTVQQVLLIEGSNALQLAVLAAPRTGGLWEEVRGDIRKSLYDDGVGAEEVDGPWGIELKARLRTPEGFVDLRFVGVDGPRWMIQGVYQGPAATDPGEAGLLQDCLSNLAVRRGEDARPVREPLPMRLPEQMAVPQTETEANRYSTPMETLVEEPPMIPRRKPSPRPRRD